MDNTILFLLRDAMYGTAPTGETAKGLRDCSDPEQLMRLAEIHNILPLVGPVFLEAVPDYPEKEKLRQYLRTHIGRQVMASAQLRNVASALNEAEIPYLVVKGAAIRALYPEPDRRPSTDEDIYVGTAEVEKTKGLLETLGFSGDRADDGEPVLHYYGYGLHIELHTRLSERPELEAYFAGQLKSPQLFELEGTMVHTMPNEAHFLFLAEHFYRHFIHGGVGIRQVADMVLLAQQPGICWEHVWEQLEKLHLGVLTCGVLEIGEGYLGLPAGQAQIPQEIQVRCPRGDDLLLDILDAGVFGGSTMERRHSSTITVRAAEGDRNKSSMLKTLFPGKTYMASGYPYLTKAPWLLPVAWGSRIAGYLREGKSAGKRAAESLSMGQRRIRLMQEYELIDREG